MSNTWDHGKDVDRFLAGLRLSLLAPEARRLLADEPGARFDVVTRLGVRLDEAASALGRSARDDAEALRLLVLLGVARERREWRHSDHPCERCKAVEVRVRTDDDSDDATVWCYDCGRRYRVDGADS